MKKVTIVWFKKDLRLKDNLALLLANKKDKIVIPLYILDENLEKLGGASKWWLHHSLVSLDKDLKSKGSRLILKRGNVLDVLQAIARIFSIESIYWHKTYTPDGIRAEKSVQDYCEKNGINAHALKGNVLFEPGEIATLKGGSFSVYTPFWKALNQKNVEPVLPEPPYFQTCPSIESEDIPSWNLLDGWSHKLEGLWQVNESAALHKLDSFLNERVQKYHISREMPGVDGTSYLSPYFHFGQLSVRDVWHQTNLQMQINADGLCTGYTTFLKELVWREFCYHLYFHQPRIQTENFRKDFDGFPWLQTSSMLHAWQRGQTGYPIIDAGMRQLWQTGWMHNRVRMIVASFLTKNMLVDWRVGESWFWDTLVDADQANNIANWQWVAGCGADASPYFRIFNPILQGEKFDVNGDYIRRWVPELASLPGKFIHTPFKQNSQVLGQYGVQLGIHYPNPILDLKQTRQAALDAFKNWAKPGIVPW